MAWEIQRKRTYTRKKDMLITNLLGSAKLVWIFTIENLRK
jgi:hypothetical protein